MRGKRGNHGQGWNFHQAKLRETVAKAASENAARVKCPHCPLMILDMAEHMRIVHADD